MLLMLYIVAREFIELSANILHLNTGRKKTFGNIFAESLGSGSGVSKSWLECAWGLSVSVVFCYTHLATIFGNPFHKGRLGEARSAGF